MRYATLWLATILSIAIGVASSSVASSAPSPVPTQVLTPVGDTILDAAYDDIFASVVGCDVRKTDRVLVNGLAEDGINWDRPHIVPETTVPVSAVESKLASGLRLAPAGVLPMVSFRLKPGYYNFTLTVGACSSTAFPLIAWHFYGRRHLTVFANPHSPRPTPEGHTETALSGLVGAIPIADLQVTLSASDSNRWYVARTESDDNFLGNHYMYFFDGVTPGHYNLEVLGLGWKRTIGDVDLSEPGKVVYKEITFTDVGP